MKKIILAMALLVAALVPLTNEPSVETVNPEIETVDNYPYWCNNRWLGYRASRRNTRVPSFYIVNAMHVTTNVYYRVWLRTDCRKQLRVIGARYCWYIEYGTDPHVPGNFGFFNQSHHNLYIRDKNERRNPGTWHVDRDYFRENQQSDCRFHNFANIMLENWHRPKWKVEHGVELVDYPDWHKWIRYKRFRPNYDRKVRRLSDEIQNVT